MGRVWLLRLKVARWHLYPFASDIGKYGVGLSANHADALVATFSPVVARPPSQGSRRMPLVRGSAVNSTGFW